MGGNLTDKTKLLHSVAGVVSSQILNTTNKPTGADTASDDTWGASKNGVKHVATAHTNIAPGTISITFVGETHKSGEDMNTANDILRNHSNADLIFYERGLHTTVYPGPTVATSIVREEDLTTSFGDDWGKRNFGVSPDKRDTVVAGYLVLCVASGNQNMSPKIIMLCGENHVGVLHYFNEIASRAAPWLLKRTRKLHFIKSHTTDKANKWGRSI
jgi:hypothetical protein